MTRLGAPRAPAGQPSLKLPRPARALAKAGAQPGHGVPASDGVRESGEDEVPRIFDPKLGPEHCDNRLSYSNIGD
jgi:hypothetical protein